MHRNSHQICLEAEGQSVELNSDAKCAVVLMWMTMTEAVVTPPPICGYSRYSVMMSKVGNLKDSMSVGGGNDV